jgi:hypothetical protein
MSDAYSIMPGLFGAPPDGIVGPASSIMPSMFGAAGGAGGAAGGIAGMLGPLSIAGPIVSAASSAIQGITGFISGQQQAKAAEAKATQDAQQAGVNTQERLLQGGATLGRAATLAAASGGGLGGSTAGVLNQIAERGMFNARAAAYKGITDVDADRYMASVDKDNAVNSLIGGFTGAVGQGVAGALKSSFRQSILSSKAYQSGDIDSYSASLALGG